MNRILLISSLLLSSLCSAQDNVDDRDIEIVRSMTLVSGHDTLSDFSHRARKNSAFDLNPYLASSIHTFSLSPNGEQLLMRKAGHIILKNMLTDEEKSLDVSNDCWILDFNWLDDNDYLLECERALEKKSFIIVNKTTEKLTPVNLAPAVSSLIRIDMKRKKVYLQSAVEDGRYFDVYEVDWQTGASKKIFDSGEKLLAGITVTDGKVIRYTHIRDGNAEHMVLKNGQYLPTITHGINDRLQIDAPLDTTKPNLFYAISSLGRDALIFGVYDSVKQKVIKVLSHRPNINLENVVYDNNKTPLVVIYNPDLVEERYDFLSETLENNFKLAEKTLEKRLANLHRVDFTYSSTDSSRLLVTARGESATSSLYWFDAKTQILKNVHDSYKTLSNPRMRNPVKPIKFSSRDGVDIHGYLTIPSNHLKGEDYALIVLPHGGPIGKSDRWVYDPMVQYLASHGYAILQVNYRVSSGKNRAFEEAGYGKLGYLPMHDIEDGIEHVIKQGLVRKNQVVGLGFSYGGYAVTRGSVLYTNRYRCLASVMGVYDVAEILRDSPLFWQVDKSELRSLWHEAYTTRGEDALREISPLTDADKIKAPVLIIHGEYDIRTNIKQANDMVETLRGHNEHVYYHTYPDGHTYFNPETFNMILGFFDTCLDEDF